MMQVKERDGEIEVYPNVRGPVIYLDYTVVSHIAGTEDGQRFRQYICDKGTLGLFWSDLVRLFALNDSRESKKVRAYLDGFGPHFVVMYIDPREVFTRECSYVAGRDPHPALDIIALEVLAKYCRPSETPSILHLLKGLRGERGLFAEMQDTYEEHKKRRMVVG